MQSLVAREASVVLPIPKRKQFSYPSGEYFMASQLVLVVLVHSLLISHWVNDYVATAVLYQP